ncbi:GNAT family N-acetyltransferase [Algoriphagus sp. D3-2-R+10]|uniref:GNAT family N-acetyltransferase n=1 Tax=Algoriphagus aurantiacus TaxID=3103948 RepID=UPI002B3734C8|nr:GNAT family N-acetyltransferase [Algoriphagus sp. D3-2-R+10]MEB2778478.1 GNAT family N-acetyltransferase [Algoriphagus sp. D3-2-R+10]
MILLGIFENIDFSSNFIPIVGFTITILTFIITLRLRKLTFKKLANREVYLKLELASIDLFRFEATNVDVIRPLWEKDIDIPKKGTAEYLVLMNYVCQMLNLFELAIKFRKSKDKILPPDLFSSWVAWFHSLVTAPGFPIIWEDVNNHYIIDLRNIMSGGIEITKEHTNPDFIEEKFYNFVAFVLDCDVIKYWLSGSEEQKRVYKDFNKSRKMLTSETTRSINKPIEITYIQDKYSIQKYVDFFIENTTNNYISHGEIQYGRAINSTEWVTNLNSKLINDFTDVLENSEAGNLISTHTAEGVLVGFIFLEYFDSPNGVYATLSDIVISEDYRRLGIGNEMINWVFKELDRKNIPTIYAESNLNNISAHNFLNKHGFLTISKVFKKDLII